MFEFLVQELDMLNPWLIILFLIIVICSFIIFIIKFAVREAMRAAMRDPQFREDLRNTITYANIRAIEQARGKSSTIWDFDQTK